MVYNGPYILAPILEIVPPTFKVNATPAPPDTIKAPVDVEVDAVVLVTAKPEAETIPVLGLTTKETMVESPSPEPLLAETAVIKKD